MNMNRINNLACAALAALAGLTSNPLGAEPYPLEYFALRDLMSNVQVSPDGKYLGLMKIPAKDAEPIIEVYDAADLSKQPFRVNADPMEITGFDWVSNTSFVMSLRQQVRNKIEDFNQGVYETRIAHNHDVQCRDYADGDEYYNHAMSFYYYGDVWTVGAGVRNVFDDAPPQIDGTECCFSINNTPVGLGYDVNGRTYFADVQVIFGGGL